MHSGVPLRLLPMHSGVPLRPIATLASNAADGLAAVLLGELGVLEDGEAVLQLRGDEVRPHLVRGVHGYELALLPLALLGPLLQLVLVVHDGDTSSSAEIREGGGLAAPRVHVDVGLIQDHVSRRLAGDLHELVEDRCSLGDEFLPTLGIVPLTPHVHDLHLVDDGVCTEEQVILQRVGLHVLLCPIGLAASWQTTQHDELSFLEGCRMVYWVHHTVLLWRLLEKLDLIPGWIKPLVLSPEIHLATHVLHQQVREDACLLRCWRHIVESDTYKKPILHIGDSALVDVDNAPDDVARGELSPIVAEIVVVRLLAGSSPTPAIGSVAEKKRGQRV